MVSSELAGADKAWLRAQAAAKSQALATEERKLAEAAADHAVAAQVDIAIKAARIEAVYRAVTDARIQTQEMARQATTAATGALALLEQISAGDAPFDDTVAQLGVSTVREAILALLARIAQLEGGPSLDFSNPLNSGLIPSL